MIKIYLGRISELIKNNKYDSFLNPILEISEKRVNEKKAGEILLLTALEEEKIVIDEPLEYIYHGTKPYLKKYNYYYNLSHTQDFLVLAISNQEVGIDIEKQKRMVKKIKEINNIQEWTIAEAAVKFLGSGIKDLKKIKLDNDCLYIEGEKHHYQTYKQEDCFISIVYKTASEIQIITL